MGTGNDCYAYQLRISIRVETYVVCSLEGVQINLQGLQRVHWKLRNAGYTIYTVQKLSDQKVDYQQNMKFLLFLMSIILLTGSIGSEEQKGKYYAYLLSISRINTNSDLKLNS